MYKQPLIRGLVGTVIALGLINVAAAEHQSWHYDASSDTVRFAVSGPNSGDSGNREYPAPRENDLQSWRYDVYSDTVFFAGGGNRESGRASSAAADASIAMNNNLPWYYYN